MRDGPTTTITIFEFISRRPIFQLWGALKCCIKFPLETCLADYSCGCVGAVPENNKVSVVLPTPLFTPPLRVLMSLPLRSVWGERPRKWERFRREEGEKDHFLSHWRLLLRFFGPPRNFFGPFGPEVGNEVEIQFPGPCGPGGPKKLKSESKMSQRLEFLPFFQLFDFSSEFSKRGLAAGVGDKQTPKKTQKSSPIKYPPSKRVQKRGLNVWHMKAFLTPTPSVRQPLFETSGFNSVLNFLDPGAGRPGNSVCNFGPEGPKNSSGGIEGSQVELHKLSLGPEAQPRTS